MGVFSDVIWVSVVGWMCFFGWVGLGEDIIWVSGVGGRGWRCYLGEWR